MLSGNSPNVSWPASGELLVANYILTFFTVSRFWEGNLFSCSPQIGRSEKEAQLRESCAVHSVTSVVSEAL